MGLSIALTSLINEIGLWSFFVFVKAYESKLSKIRDSIALINLYHINIAINEIRQMEKTFFEIERNIPSYTSELGYYCNIDNFHKRYLKFTPVNLWLSQNDFFKNICILMIDEVEYLKELHKNIRQAINITSQNISSLSNDYVAKTNIRIQKLMIFLTCAILLLTIVTGWNTIKEFFLYIFHNFG
ncbi:hypothetical protein LLG96_02575 [bacterium]|nr:hypothetical protein [bacterium]